MTDRGSKTPVADFRRVATEEAFLVPEVYDALRSWVTSGSDDPDHDFWSMVLLSSNPFTDRVRRQLLDLEDERLSIMDESGVDVHLLSLTSPGVQVFDGDTAIGLARLVNDRVAEVIARHPTRFAALATVAPQDPKGSAEEMRRAVEDLHLNGFMINSHTDGHYLDEEQYLPILEAADGLARPIYIHPRAPSPQMAEPYRRFALASALWGYQAETGLHAIRLICSGIFDRFPDLKVVLGHMGEGLPYWFWRLDFMHTAGSTRRPKLELTPSEYFKRNFAITTSGMNWPPVLRFCQEVVGTDQIMWAIDYPYQDTAGSVSFMNELEVDNESKAALFSKNAERIFEL